jgi:protease PrsW
MFVLYHVGLDTLAIYLLAALVPAILLLIYIYNHDRVEKEPFGLLFKLFLSGVLCVIPAVILESIVDIYLLPNIQFRTQVRYAIMSALSVGLIEEGCKFFFLKRKTWKNYNFNYTFDGIVYAVFVSLGFAAIENILYVVNYGLSVAVSRALTAIPGHMCFAVFMGYFYSEAKRYKSSKYLLLSYLSAVCVHTAYDAILMVDSEISSIIFIVFVIVMYIVVYKKVKKASIEDAHI